MGFSKKKKNKNILTIGIVDQYKIPKDTAK